MAKAASIIVAVNEDYLTTRETAALLKVSEARVRQLANSDRLKSHKRGRDHLFLREDVEAFADKPRKKTGRPPSKS